MKKVIRIFSILVALSAICIVVYQIHKMYNKDVQEGLDEEISYTPSRKNEKPDYPGPFDNPLEFHYELLDFGERPCWSPDGKRIAFVESNYGDICEIDFITRKVKNLTKNLGNHHSFLRVHYLPTGDYILIGPAEFKDRNTSRLVESELWFMDKDAKEPPKQLGKRIFEGCATSRIANRISYSVSSRQDSLIERDFHEICVADVEITGKNARLVNERVVYRAGRGLDPESQDFRQNDSEIIVAEYTRGDAIRGSTCTVKGIKIETGEVKLYLHELGVYNEPEGIFPNDENFICVESTAYNEDITAPPTDVWKLKLDGINVERVRMTRMFERKPWRSSNPVVSPDGKWLAFMINLHTSEAGYGMGLGLLDLEAWGKSEYAKQWEIPKNIAHTDH